MSAPAAGGPAVGAQADTGPFVILGIETSCDETAAALVANGVAVMSSVVSSQVDLHARFGGVVPEIASRAHVQLLTPVVAEVLVEAGLDGGGVDAVAATVGPGLVGSLLVGIAAAKAYALVWGVPFIGVDHMEGHLYAGLLERADAALPAVVLLVSGGHTQLVLMEGHARYRLLGTTVDDAVGEAYDKVARFLGLGYPGGPVIDRMAAHGDAEAVRFPRPMLNEGYDFSFSGLKTAVITYVRAHPDASATDIAASFQAAAVDVLVTKARRAAAETGARGIWIGGGVAANSLLRKRIVAVCEEDGIESLVPARDMCTDNAAMVAAAAWWRYQSDGATPLDAGAVPTLRLV